MHGDVVRPFEEGIQVDLFDAELFEPFFRDVRVITDGLHFHSLHAFGNARTDTADADDADSLVLELDACKVLRSQLPAMSELWACGMWRVMAMIMAQVCSVAASVLEVGVLTTTMPRDVALFKSMLSTPTPARPTTFNFVAASMTFP